MGLLNYSTSIEVSQSVKEITEILVRGGASSIMTDYDGAGCMIALFSTAGIPATEYALRQQYKRDANVVVPVTAGLVAVHGGITYLLWTACWPCAVAYLGFSGVYSAVRIETDDE